MLITILLNLGGHDSIVMTLHVPSWAPVIVLLSATAILSPGIFRQLERSTWL